MHTVSSVSLIGVKVLLLLLYNSGFRQYSESVIKFEMLEKIEAPIVAVQSLHPNLLFQLLWQ